MNYLFLILLILIICLISIFGILIYSYSFYYKHLYYKTTKYRLFSIWPLCLLAIIFLVLTTVSLVCQFNNRNIFFINNSYIWYLSLIAFVESTSIVVLSFIWKKNSQKNQHYIKNFWQEDFNNQLIATNTYKKKTRYEQKLKKHHKKYYEKMHNEYDEILELINKNTFENIIFKIIDFNERFNPKFSYGFYIIHIGLFLNLCLKTKNKFIKK